MPVSITQRAGVFSELPNLLREKGADPVRVFAGSGIDPDTLDVQSRIPFEGVLQVLDRAGAMTGIPHIGLLVGLSFDLLKHHGPIAQLMMTATTLKQALLDFVTWQPGYSSGAIVYLESFGDEIAFGYATFAAASPGNRMLHDLVVGVGIRMIQILSHGRVKPIEIHFTCREPDNLAEYRTLLPYPKQFNQSRTCIFLEAEKMTAPLKDADERARARLLEQIESAIWTRPPTMTQRVNHSLRHVLHHDKPKMALVAAELGVHPRTLRRRLADENTSFEALRDEMHFTVTCELLEMTDLSVGEISAFLAFASPGVLSESFRRWSGSSPSQWRKLSRQQVT